MCGCKDGIYSLHFRIVFIELFLFVGGRDRDLRRDSPDPERKKRPWPEEEQARFSEERARFSEERARFLEEQASFFSEEE